MMTPASPVNPSRCALVSGLLIAGLFLLLLSASRLSAADLAAVGYLVRAEGKTAEDSAATSWLERHPSFRPTMIAFDAAALPKGVDVVWVHLSDSAGYRSIVGKPNMLRELRRYCENGGKALFTGFAAFLPADLGFESARPSLRVDTLKDDWLFDKKGFQGFAGHPVFHRLFGGDFVWDALENQRLPLIGYFGEAAPERGKVIAVEKSYVFLHSDRKLVIEHAPGRGRSIAVGGAVYLSRPNTLRLNLEQFLENTLLYLVGRNVAGPVTYWEADDGIARRISVRTGPPGRISTRALSDVPPAGPVLSRENPKNEFFDVAGRRALIMGKENGGIDEFWVHPIRVLRDFETGIFLGDTVAWLNTLPVAITVRPESFSRVYTIAGGTLTETIVSSMFRTGGFVQVTSSVPVRLAVRFRCDLRTMWPYDAGALGDIHYGYDEPLAALHVGTRDQGTWCVIGADRKPDRWLAGQFEGIRFTQKGLEGDRTGEHQVYAAQQYSLSAGIPLTLGVAGTTEGRGKAVADYRAIVSDPAGTLDEAAGHYRDLLSRSVAITSPDTEFSHLWPWSIVATDRFLANTPGIGEGLLAGFATTARGWTGAQRISGRPGYAWYFGRDAAWSGFAVNGYGDFDSMRKQLEMFQRFQEISGKILHELSTSGVAHFDAADATPMYVMLLAHYVRASGDTAFLRASWPHVVRAMEYQYSTDTDNDGLIENTNVGHGWVEGGALFGAHSTFYLSALWARTLDDAAYCARLMGKADLESRYADDGGKVRRILNTDFWNGESGFTRYGKLRDGSWNNEPTVLPAVGMWCGLLDERNVGSMLDAYAGNGFTTEWGVRILSGDSPLYKPRAYHAGSVWPLYTGWAALAEYAYGNSTQAFSHVMNNLRIKNHWALGFIEEVMHGSVYQPSGVCPHQCWSETNVIHPVIEGMIGWFPDAPRGVVRLIPRFPVHWDTVAVENLRSGMSVVQLSMRRSSGATSYQLRLESGAGTTVQFAPEIQRGMVVKGVLVNGNPVLFDPALSKGVLRTPLEFRLEGAVTVTLLHEGGAGMVPLLSRPVPGDSAAGYRIIRETAEGSRHTVVVEGFRGTTFEFPMVVFDRTLPRSADAGIVPAADNGVFGVRVRFGEGPGAIVQKKIVLDLSP